ncbi:SGNH/GDSL hydrolase family protein [Pseudomonas sp. MWU13-3659]|uniref:SGNH/GDSL hydrolase family protein n=1 Tax=Pseudomonas sp. MWU13-3659 TaxID=2986964 RepID=UPI002074E7DE|nr:SGNH/GDSL hydrolase family protein [Pseudomonas sp. MWU13-3659]
MRFLFSLFTAVLISASAVAEPIKHNDLNPALVDLHFGTLAGVGWYTNEPGGAIEAVSTSESKLGDFTINLASTAGFSRGQLACYQGDDDTLYPVVIKDVKPDQVVIDRPLPRAMPAGAKFYNFYGNDAHANHFGFVCVADDALRQLAERPMLRRAAQYKSASGWEVINGARSVPQPAAGYGDVGGQPEDGVGIAVHSGNAGAGVASKPVVSLYENMVTNVVINPGKQAGKQAATLDIVVTEIRPSGEIIEAARTQVTRDDTIASVDIPYTITAGSKIRVKVTVPSSSESVFYPGSITHYHALSQAEDINRGKHVLFGDSWFASGGDLHYHLIKRLNKATVVSKGIVGNRSDQLVARFFNDVPGEKPDYVWIMVGTNDYYHNTTGLLFQAQITYLVNYIQSIGAKPILFNATVGAIAPGTGGNQLLKSRSYALNTLYVPSVSFLRSPLLPVKRSERETD